jgi:hypothetical protein
MAVLEDLGSSWEATALVGLGMIVAAPVLFPALGAVVRPVAKGFIKGGLWALDSVQELAAEVWKERLAALVAQSLAEHRNKHARTA